MIAADTSACAVARCEHPAYKHVLLDPDVPADRAGAAAQIEQWTRHRIKNPILPDAPALDGERVCLTPVFSESRERVTGGSIPLDQER